MKEHQTTDIVLTYLDGRRELTQAPPDFPWLKYPEVLKYNGRTWCYAGTAAVTPYYREAGEARCP